MGKSSLSTMGLELKITRGTLACAVIANALVILYQRIAGQSFAGSLRRRRPRRKEKPRKRRQGKGRKKRKRRTNFLNIDFKEF